VSQLQSSILCEPKQTPYRQHQRAEARTVQLSCFKHQSDTTTRHENCFPVPYLGDFEHPYSWLAITAAALSVDDMDQTIGQRKVGQWSTMWFAAGTTRRWNALNGALTRNRRGYITTATTATTATKCRHGACCAAARTCSGIVLRIQHNNRQHLPDDGSDFVNTIE
jgi:hypothetical protein